MRICSQAVICEQLLATRLRQAATSRSLSTVKWRHAYYHLCSNRCRWQDRYQWRL